MTPVAPEWASQTELLAGMAQVILPQRLIRENEAEDQFFRLADDIGKPRQVYSPTPKTDTPGPDLTDIFRDDHDDDGSAAPALSPPTTTRRAAYAMFLNAQVRNRC